MSTFHLRIVTTDGIAYDDTAQKIIARTIVGDVCILSGHADYVTSVASGSVKVTTENGDTKEARCLSGILSVKNDKAHLIVNKFEWK